MKIIFVRHGETQSNKEGILAGRLDVPLNETGILQAEETATLLKDKKFDVLLCSPLVRAKQTADIINQHHNLPIVFEDALMERDYKKYEGLHASLINREESWNYYLSEKYEAETVKEVFQRVWNFVEKIKKKYAGETVLIVSHRGVGRALWCYFNGIPEDGYLLKKGMGNAEAAEFNIDD